MSVHIIIIIILLATHNQQRHHPHHRGEGIEAQVARDVVVLQPRRVCSQTHARDDDDDDDNECDDDDGHEGSTGHDDDDDDDSRDDDDDADDAPPGLTSLAGCQAAWMLLPSMKPMAITSPTANPGTIASTSWKCWNEPP
jgi:hypothetical protein